MFPGSGLQPRTRRDSSRDPEASAHWPGFDGERRRSQTSTRHQDSRQCRHGTLAPSPSPAGVTLPAGSPADHGAQSHRVHARSAARVGRRDRIPRQSSTRVGNVRAPVPRSENPSPWGRGTRPCNTPSGPPHPASARCGGAQPPAPPSPARGFRCHHQQRKMGLSPFSDPGCPCPVCCLQPGKRKRAGEETMQVSMRARHDAPSSSRKRSGPETPTCGSDAGFPGVPDGAWP